MRVVRNENFDYEWIDELTREVQSLHIANITGQKVAESPPPRENSNPRECTNHAQG